MLDAGRYFLRKQQRSLGVSEQELIRTAIRSLGLDELAPFIPEERIIEYRLRERGWRATGADDGTRRSPTRRRRNRRRPAAARWPPCSARSARRSARWWPTSRRTSGAGMSGGRSSRGGRSGDSGSRTELLDLVDEDTLAFERVMTALGMPKGTAEEKAARSAALAAANLGALQVPWQVMQAAFETFDLLDAMAESGNPASASDAGVGAICARAAVRGRVAQRQDERERSEGQGDARCDPGGRCEAGEARRGSRGGDPGNSGVEIRLARQA